MLAQASAGVVRRLQNAMVRPLMSTGNLTRAYVSSGVGAGSGVIGGSAMLSSSSGGMSAAGGGSNGGSNGGSGGNGQPPRTVSIGDVTLEIREPKYPELAPISYLENEAASGSEKQTDLMHLRWMMQKDLLGQDIFLVGPPGPRRRRLALKFCELTQREVEYISLCRDTTEADIKQRREIISSTAYYMDQAAVKAALEGRVLILEGIEKAERNVLPILNNLLENREMRLEDGRFLVAPERFDKLLEDHDPKELEAMKLVRVSERFRVIALGLPVPRFRGNPLDPPLRSRFQARDITTPPYGELLEMCHNVAGGQGTKSAEAVESALKFASAIQAADTSQMVRMSEFPMDNMDLLATVAKKFPAVDPLQLARFSYPIESTVGQQDRDIVEGAAQSLGLSTRNEGSYLIGDVQRLGNEERAAKVVFKNKKGGEDIGITVPGGPNSTFPPAAEPFIETAFHQRMMADMIMTHAVGDFAVIGPRGCGKSAMVNHFAGTLGYNVEPVMLYNDMTARDLLQQRATKPNGDTYWRYSPLVMSALEGSLCVLDGIHRINHGTFTVLQRLVQDRELVLFEGKRLMGPDRYEAIKDRYGLNDMGMNERGIMRIHPSFRIVALSEPPSSSGTSWLSSEILSMFMYHQMRTLSISEEQVVLQGAVPNVPQKQLDKLLNFVQEIRQTQDPSLSSISQSLSTRQLIRISKALASYQDQGAGLLYTSIHRACLSRFLPSMARESLEKLLEEQHITPAPTKKGSEKAAAFVGGNAGHSSSIEYVDRDGKKYAKIGRTVGEIRQNTAPALVPDILFYENDQHMRVLEEMLQDFNLGDHLLLIGNQGVGKNKLVDRFLQVLNQPREYLQLHRDTTVQTLTLQPSVKDGVLTYEDSALVRAVTYGHILVVDEADKAPTNVTCILKTLVESGEMLLSDGRKIYASHAFHNTDQTEPEHGVIRIHPEFRMFILANRPGFPFLGNDFFAAMGDIFSCHAVDNPDLASEISMLKKYGPNVPTHILEKLSLAFDDLRKMVDEGSLQYPYSTRELVNVVRHLQEFPDENVGVVMRNVFDFDAYDKDVREVFISTLVKHGIPLVATANDISLAPERNLPATIRVGTVSLSPMARSFKVPAIKKPLEMSQPVLVSQTSSEIDRQDCRGVGFAEEMYRWSLPFDNTNLPLSAASSSATDAFYVLGGQPVTLWQINDKHRELTTYSLQDFFPHSSPFFIPSLRLVAPDGIMSNHICIHDAEENSLLLLDTSAGTMRRCSVSQGVFNEAASHFNAAFGRHNSDEPVFTAKPVPGSGSLMIYSQFSKELAVVDLTEGATYSMTLPFAAERIDCLDQGHMVIRDTENQHWLFHRRRDDESLTSVPEVLQLLEGFPNEEMYSALSSGQMSTTALQLSRLPNGEIDMQATVNVPDVQTFATADSYAYIAQGMPQRLFSNEKVELHSIPRSGRIEMDPHSSLFMSKTNQVVHRVSAEVEDVVSQKHAYVCAMEVNDLVRITTKTIAVPRGPPVDRPYYARALAREVPVIHMLGLASGNLATVDIDGHIRCWQTYVPNLQLSLEQWQQMMGNPEKMMQENGKLRIEHDRNSGLDVKDPKHGKVDKENKPHVGGNQWAGGTGGRDTAGLGGKGGPYRLDLGHDVYQLSDEEKAQVPEEVARAARAMGEKALADRLKEIKMSDFDNRQYEQFAEGIKKQTKELRAIVQALQAKGQDRVWLKNQSDGDLDDNRLIEGLTGESSIYKRRGYEQPEFGVTMKHPKRMRLVMDCSGSMYRFNGMDNRLSRAMETALMVMESLQDTGDRFKYEIVGHSGDSPSIPLVPEGKEPKNKKDRMDVLLEMQAHSQFCMSGDHTVEALKQSINEMAQKEADESFVCLISDANLDRYGIHPQQLTKIMDSESKVNAVVIFIGTIGDQAEKLRRSLPTGRAFVCMNTQDLPKIMSEIFRSSILKSNDNE